MSRVKGPPPLALFLLAAAAQRVLTSGAAPPTPTSRAASMILGVPAVALLAAPVAEFRRRRTTVDPRAHARPTSLVTGGINAYTRNPMYAGMAGLLLANAARRPTPQGLLPAIAFVAWIDRFQIPAEEAALHELFGDEYNRYRARVARWAGFGSTRRH